VERHSTLARARVAAILGTACLVGCNLIVTNGQRDDGRASSSGGAGSSSGGFGATSGGTSTGGISQGTSGGAQGSSGTSGSTGASATTGSSTGPPPPIIDGGYVFCAGDGGASWLCPPGTYICDYLSGSLYNCLQCRSDADCANQALPTYDPNRLHCGFESFCQQCTKDADCVDNPAGPYCNLQYDSLQSVGFGFPAASILTVGYETCGQFELDCRVDAGESCRGLNELCSDAGSCEGIDGYCETNEDCAGYLDVVPSFLPVPAPYCVSNQCQPCAPDGGYCIGPYGDCPSYGCNCTSDAQCGGLWPVCEGLSQGLGYCGCDTDAQCGDGGLACLGTAFALCSVPCDAPGYPSCTSTGSGGPICDPKLRICLGCSSDADCQAAFQPNGPHCEIAYGACVCEADTDCPTGQVCTDNRCALPPPPCLRNCLAEDGGCVNDYDCTAQLPEGPCCNAGACGLCPGTCSYAECQNSPLGSVCMADYSTCGCYFSDDCNDPIASCQPSSGNLPGVCRDGCRLGVECPDGLSCDPIFSCRPRCDGDGGACSANAPICDTDNRVGLNDAGGEGSAAGAIWCYQCREASDCPAPFGCGADTGYTCDACQTDGDCRGGEECLDGGVCRALCDGGTCSNGQICDVQDIVGVGSNVCYPCLSPADCPGHEGCNSITHDCGSCWGPNWLGPGPFGDPRLDPQRDCPPGDVCSNYWSPSPGDGFPTGAGVCLQNCDTRPCETGLICAVFPELTPDHKYCFGCLQDSDCADAGAGARCNLSPEPTFTCTHDKL